MRRWSDRIAAGALVVCAAAVVLTVGSRRPSSAEPVSPRAAVRRGTLTMHLIAGGAVTPVRSISYASPVAGRELEIVELAPEGTQVAAGDLLFRLDTRELERDLARARADVRQVRVDVIKAEIDKKEAEADQRAVDDGSGTIATAEASAQRDLAERTAARLRAQRADLERLAAGGFITRDELKKTVNDLAQAEADLALATKRVEVIATVSHPQDERRAALRLAQKQAQLENVRVRAIEADTRLATLETALRGCAVSARAAGLVVYEEFRGAGIPRKIRAGDRVSSSQQIVTIPDLSRMQLDASVGEADVRALRAGQRAVVSVDALPGRALAGTVARVASLGRVDGRTAAKRFDVVVAIDTRDAGLRPGMSARADIAVGERDNVLVAPVGAIGVEQGATIVRVVAPDGRLETRRVVVGAVNDAMAEIISGLREGDRVAIAAQRSRDQTVSAPGATPPTGW